MKRFLLRGGVLLAGSAIASKFLSFFRDRFLVDIFPASEIDLIFAAFRIPDFFFNLFVGATLGLILIPRLADLKTDPEKYDLISSFLWKILIFFGLLCGIGVFFSEGLAELFARGFGGESQKNIALLAQFLFGSVFLLGLSGVFAAALQSRERFISVAAAPIFYAGSIVLGLALFRDQWGILIVGFSAMVGALLHFLINVGAFFIAGGQINFAWKRPRKAWENFWPDFWRRVGNASAFQVNQSADVLIASFLMAGSVAAFSIGTNLGHILLSIVGFSVANAAFPKLSQAKHNLPAQFKILKKSLRWIVLFCVPTAFLGAILATPILEFLFNLSGKTLEMTATVFFWTVLSLPAACAIPVLSRIFLANDDTITPLKVNIFSLSVATGLAAILCLSVLPSKSAILGLAIGNFVANFLTAGIFGISLWKIGLHKG